MVMMFERSVRRPRTDRTQSSRLRDPDFLPRPGQPATWACSCPHRRRDRRPCRPRSRGGARRKSPCPARRGRQRWTVRRISAPARESSRKTAGHTGYRHRIRTSAVRGFQQGRGKPVWSEGADDQPRKQHSTGSEGHASNRNLSDRVATGDDKKQGKSSKDSSNVRIASVIGNSPRSATGVPEWLSTRETCSGDGGCVSESWYSNPIAFHLNAPI